MTLAMDARTARFHAMRGCPRILSGVRPVTPAERLARIAAALGESGGTPDFYGDGGAVDALQERVADLLGTESALLFPTGTMAQQVALRCWAERTGSPAVAMHHLAHPILHESGAVTSVTGLRPVVLHRGYAQLTAADIRGLAEPVGTVFVELPLREGGFTLPSWTELAELVEAARERDAILHLDGARLWESAPFYGRQLAEIADLFDSVYVSLYKSLGVASGACLAGPAEFVDQAAVWRHRYGGLAFQMWPVAAEGLAALDDTLPLLPARVAHAKTVAAALASVPGAHVHPAQPHTHQFHIRLPYPAELLERLTLEFAAERGEWLIAGWHEPTAPGLSLAEVTVAEPALQWTEGEVADAFGEFVRRAAAEG